MRVVRSDLEDPRLHLLVCGHTHIHPNRWNFSRVSFPYWRLYWNASAGASVRYDNITIPLTPSRAILIRPNAVFSTLNHNTCEHLYIHFRTSIFVNPSTPQIIKFAMKSPLTEIGSELRRTLTASNPSTWKVSLMARALVETSLASTDLHKAGHANIDGRILRVLAYMDEHLKPTTTNADLAREAHLSSGALNHLFKTQLGHSLQAALRKKRVEKAALLLQFSDLPIDQVAEETGFCDRYHFTKVFHRLQGASPAAFRHTHANPFFSHPPE